MLLYNSLFLICIIFNNNNNKKKIIISSFNPFHFSFATLNMFLWNSGTSGAGISEVVLGASTAFS